MSEIRKNRVYTSKEVEALLKISSSTLKRLLKNGFIRANKIGGQYRFLGSELLSVVSPKTDKQVKQKYLRKKKTKAVTNLL